MDRGGSSTVVLSSMGWEVVESTSFIDSRLLLVGCGCGRAPVGRVTRLFRRPVRYSAGKV